MLGDLYLIDLSSLCRCASPASSFPPLPHSAGNRVFILDSMEAVFALLCLVFVSFYYFFFLFSGCFDVLLDLWKCNFMAERGGTGRQGFFSGFFSNFLLIIISSSSSSSFSFIQSSSRVFIFVEFIAMKWWFRFILWRPKRGLTLFVCSFDFPRLCIRLLRLRLIRKDHYLQLLFVVSFVASNEVIHLGAKLSERISLKTSRVMAVSGSACQYQ